MFLTVFNLNVHHVCVVFQLVDCLQWRVQNEIDNILSVSLSYGGPLLDFFISSLF